ncbi:hypothetical protein Kpol_2002p34 [Vanderwaltozyma polyspora DSM 70294]|uniref:HTH La-type RNA-binding domain-containing protein n=1 Tax=Vanderwaltozyma polyspora (strain ATCC 22028 / DSM 70294 / BCRC 21397 / CBS 2163 / NBRC 10782 / NRRL Y-8283 / UCD 57-17) TaxID=436907 RepID=A7TFF0_VANPO|nr:uncharacterized protein Kpol_2002p34 [Vanderwaltozyma polyspora DSM 70294]EDO18964.1 hypothetical protein Kpol_2002p34 [Vanderwaltozyma polyspora DSM 70294]
MSAEEIVSTEVAVDEVSEGETGLVKETDAKAKSLVPAPVPTKSPWKAVSSDIPVQEISLESKKSLKPKKKNNSGSSSSIKLNSSTKWVPIKASIVVSSDKNDNNGKRNNSKNNSSKGGKKKQLNGKSQQHPSKSQNGKNEKKNEPVISSNDTSKKDEHDKSTQRRKNNKNNQRKKHDNNSVNEKYNNNNNSKNNHNQNHQQKQNRYHDYASHYNSHQMYQPYYSIQPLIAAVNNVASQIEYYFSKENLEKDAFLRSKILNDGYVALSLISKFYRVVNMSFGGDTNVILAALSEIINNENATVEVAIGSIEESKAESALDMYFIRSKEWVDYVPVEVTEKVTINSTLSGSDLDQYRITIPQIQNFSQQHTQDTQQHTQDTQQEEQN